MNHHEPVESFLSFILSALENSCDDDGAWSREKREGTAAFRQALTQASPRLFEPSTVSVLESAAQLGNADLATAFRQVSKHLPWVPSFRSDDGGRAMALCALNDVLSLDPVRAGLVYVGAQRSYPEHQHTPQEMYLILAGEARWRHGGNAEYKPVRPGVSIYNPSDSLHGIVAGSDPVVALYVLWGMQS